MAPRTRGLVVEGWRFICHSYAIVNQWQLLALLRRGDLRLSVRDLPYFNPQWQRSTGIFEPADEQALAAIPAAGAGEAPDATLRIAAPYDFTLAADGVTAVFGTAEFCAIPASYLTGSPDIARLAQEPKLKVISPSRWSAQGFVRLGLRPEQVTIVPHGVDVSTFRPARDSRERVRQTMGLSNFVFLSIGAMTANKGMDVLLRAFAAVASREPRVMLFLKGADGLYNSAQMLDECFAQLAPQERKLVEDRLVYNGEPLSMKQMAALYNACDAYVAPYRAEGFNLPVLEAAACGLPVICTGGGSTDDFVTDAFALRIRSMLMPVMVDGTRGEQLEPDANYLGELMLRVVEDESWRQRAALAGPQHAAAGYTWDMVAQRLVEALL